MWGYWMMPKSCMAKCGPEKDGVCATFCWDRFSPLEYLWIHEYFMTLWVFKRLMFHSAILGVTKWMCYSCVRGSAHDAIFCPFRQEFPFPTASFRKRESQLLYEVSLLSLPEWDMFVRQTSHEVRKTLPWSSSETGGWHTQFQPWSERSLDPHCPQKTLGIESIMW